VQALRRFLIYGVGGRIVDVYTAVEVDALIKEARWIAQRATLNCYAQDECNWNERRIAFLKATEGVG
jgi:hypothetical protein